MKNILFIFVFLLVQQPFDITPHIVEMQDGWSIGNGCEEMFTEWISTSSIETNGHTLEIMNASLDISGFIYENGVQMDLMELLISEKVVLSCLNSSISVHNPTLGIDDEEFEQTKVFPNPFQNHINVIRSDMVLVSILDINGRFVSGAKVNSNELVMNLEFLQNGVYFMIIEFESKSPETIKIIKN